MTYPIDKKLVVAVSSRALFDMDAANEIFERKGVDAYRKYQLEHIEKPFDKGVAFPFIRRLLKLNGIFPEEQPVEVVVLSRNDPDSGRRFFNTCRHYGLNITRGAFLSGKSPYRYVKAFNASLFLSANKADVEDAINRRFPAGLVLPTATKDDDSDNELRIAFDFDGVIADDEAETVYQTKSLDAFKTEEMLKAKTPHNPGPLKDLITKIAFFQKLEARRLKQDHSYTPVLRIAIVTARDAPAHERLITTLNAWNLTAVETFLLGGIEKKRVLEVLKPHIYFDDQLYNLMPSAAHIPSVHIPFGIANRPEGHPLKTPMRSRAKKPNARLSRKK